MTVTLLSTDPNLLKTARQSPTVVMATPPHEPQSATLLYLLTMSTESGEESCKQRFRSLQTTVLGVRNFRYRGQHGTIRADHDVQVRFQGRGRGRTCERNSEASTTVQWGDGTDPVPDQVKKSVHHFEHAGAIEDSSLAEGGKAGQLRWSARGDRRVLEEPTHLQDDNKREHTRR